MLILQVILTLYFYLHPNSQINKKVVKKKNSSLRAAYKKVDRLKGGRLFMCCLTQFKNWLAKPYTGIEPAYKSIYDIKSP